MKNRKALSSIGGRIATRGPERETALLRSVMDIAGGEDWQRLTHGFHAYPARMHPEIPRRLLEALALPGDKVLDPFVGSGTVLVEAMLAGCRGLGIDIHPLAVRLTRIKTALWGPEELDELRQAGEAIGENAYDLARTRGRAPGPPRPFDRDEAKWYQPHVRWELSNLIAGIEQVESSRVRDALEMVLSSMLVKVSNQTADSNLVAEVTHLSRGFTSRFFTRKSAELVARLAELAAAVPEGAQPPKVREGDARRLAIIDDRSVQLVITSPPYLGTYDYLAHQARRATILGIRTKRAMADEIGSRRTSTDPEMAIERWRQDLDAVLREMERVLVPRGHALLLIGTSRVGDEIVHSDEILEDLAPRAGLEVIAVASQDRPDRGPGGADSGTRPEHLVWLRPQVGSRRNPPGRSDARR